MSVLDIIQTRRSIRTFIKKPISDEDAIKILDYKKDSEGLLKKAFAELKKC